MQILLGESYITLQMAKKRNLMKNAFRAITIRINNNIRNITLH